MTILCGASAAALYSSQAGNGVNGPAVEAAVGLLGGPDKVTTPLWWDKN